MRLNVLAFALACGIIWAIALGFVAAAPLIGWEVGANFVAVFDFYPGYEQTSTGALLGLLYGFLDGAAFGAIVAWLYNRFA